MKDKIFLSSVVALPLAATALLGGTSSAEAATITGAGEFDFSSAVTVQGVPATNFDFQYRFTPAPEQQPARGDFIILSTEDGFNEFDGEVGLIKDVTIGPTGDDVDPPTPITEFLDLGDGNTFTLESVAEEPTFTQFGGDVTVDIGVEGTFFSSTIGALPGSGVFTAQFVNTTVEQVLDRVGTEEGLTTSYSASFQATPEEVPEPATLGGLAVLGLGAFLKKRKKQQTVS